MVEEISRHITQIRSRAQRVEKFAHSAQLGSGRLTEIFRQLKVLVGRLKF